MEAVGPPANIVMSESSDLGAGCRSIDDGVLAYFYSGDASHRSEREREYSVDNSWSLNILLFIGATCLPLSFHQATSIEEYFVGSTFSLHLLEY